MDAPLLVSVNDGSKSGGEVGERINGVQFTRFYERGDDRPVLGSIIVSGEERILTIEGHRPDILPISGTKSRSITAGMHFMVGMSDVTTASGAMDRKSSLSCMNPE